MNVILRTTRFRAKKLILLITLSLWILVGVSSFVNAAEKPSAKESSVFLVDEIKVVGSKANIKNIAGSAAYVDTSDIRKQSYDNIDRVLRKVPGVYTREEDGFGLFPNISLRGVDPGRSGKVTIMEDGILTAPATYSAPSAYYSPTAGRMDAIEVLKGSSQIKYGPHTTGGVINYLSTPIPTTEQYYLKSTFGTFEELRNHLFFGNTINTKNGRVGFLIENYDRRNGGFKTIDTTPDFRNGDNTGFRKTEPMIKLSWEPNSQLYQRFDVKFGYTKLRANETYLGLPEADFRIDPFRRLAATRFDRIDTEHFRSSIRHFLELSGKTNIVTTAYGNHFGRNWQKSHDCRDPKLGLSRCLLDSTGLQVLSGTAAGEWRLRNNNRSYYMAGIQSNLNHKMSIGSTQHDIDFGIRLHYDQVRRNQFGEFYTQDANGAIISRADGAPGSDGNRRQRTHALSLSLEDAIKFGRFTFKPGIRGEQIWQRFEQFAPASEKDKSGAFNLIAGGASLNYEMSRATNIFGGVHRGYSPPGPKAFTDNGLVEETSLGYEAGVRYAKPALGFSTEAILFWTDFDDLIIADSIGASGLADGGAINAGEVRTRGVEFQVSYDPAVSRKWSFSNPWYFTMTYTDATIQSDIASGSIADDATIFSGATKGNKVPNVPEIQLAFGTGLQFEKLSVDVSAQYVDETFASGSNVTTAVDPFGRSDARFGKVDDSFLVDLSLAYQLNKRVQAFTNIRNLTNQEYISTRQPHGPRPGAPLQAFAGLEMNF